MGEAKRREQAFSDGKEWPRRRVCPVRKCQSPRVIDIPADHEICRFYARFWRNENLISLRMCKHCKAIWEPWPDDAPTDCVERAHSHGPCSNCAYRVGSWEMSDPEEREKMLQTARNAAEFGYDAVGILTQFCCHKGIPVRIDPEDPGALTFDYEAAGVDPLRQTCTGFLLAMWAVRKKRGPRSSVRSQRPQPAHG